jgi:hypothetical protein
MALNGGLVMTTAPVAKTRAYGLTLEDLKNVQLAIEGWVRQARVSRDDSRTDQWNMAQRARLESRGSSFTSYFHG